jgi:hypothetical protein
MTPTTAIKTVAARRLRKRGGELNRFVFVGGLTVLVLATLIGGGVKCLSLNNMNVRVDEAEQRNLLSRRSCLTKAAGGVLVLGSGAVAGSKPAFAAKHPNTEDEMTMTKICSSSIIESQSMSGSLETNRKRLLQLIGQPPSNNEEEILAAIENLVPLDPSKKKGASLTDDLEGEWELLWSAKAEAFSPLLKLPKPFKPDSFQYLGKAAAGEVGPNRVAQGLTGGILGQTQLWLSSGVRPSPSDDSVLDILPPFRFEVGGRYKAGTPKKRLVEAGSDAEFRKLNARTTEAQEAPKNSYQQLYLEREGKGSLRISTITAGDPVIVGAIFVHQKL